MENTLSPVADFKETIEPIFYLLEKYVEVLEKF